MADNKLIDLNGLKVFKDNYDIEIDKRIAKAEVGVTYTLTKNDDGEIVLTGTDESVMKVSDENTTYAFSQDGTILTITPSEGDPITIELGEEITSDKVIEALGYTPLNEEDVPTELSDLGEDETHRVVTDVEKADWNSKYDKPEGGIPSSDLASDIVASLGKANTALQSFTEEDPTVPSHVKSITSANISSWNSKAEVSDIPTKVSDLTNDVAVTVSSSSTYEALEA